MRPGVVLLKGNAWAMTTQKRSNNRAHDLVAVALSIEISLYHYQTGPLSCCNPTPYHNAAAPEPIFFHDTMIDVTFTSTSVHSNPSIAVAEVKTRLVSEQNLSPLYSVDAVCTTVDVLDGGFLSKWDVWRVFWRQSLHI